MKKKTYNDVVKIGTLLVWENLGAKREKVSSKLLQVHGSKMQWDTTNYFFHIPKFPNRQSLRKSDPNPTAKVWSPFSYR